MAKINAGACKKGEIGFSRSEKSVKLLIEYVID